MSFSIQKRKTANTFVYQAQKLTNQTRTMKKTTRDAAIEAAYASLLDVGQMDEAPSDEHFTFKDFKDKHPRKGVSDSAVTRQLGILVDSGKAEKIKYGRCYWYRMI
mgnify:CR=1 FL=1